MSNLIGIISDFVQTESEKITPETDIATELGMTSFDLMELSCELEEAYHIKFEPEELANVRVVNDMYMLIKNKIA